MRQRNLITVWALALCGFCSLALNLTLAVAASSIVVSCGSVGKEFDLCKTAATVWAQKTGNTVEIVSAPSDSGERLALYQLLLAAKGKDIDVFLIDTTWPGIIGDFFVDFKQYATQDQIAQHFKAFVENNTVKERLVAIPWFIDTGLLYYRKDLLKKYEKRPPQTWQELTEIAALIQDAERRSGNQQFWGYVFQGRAYEGLTCNALEWIYNFGGGTIVDKDGTITINNPNALSALELASSWVGKISPPGVLNYMEEEARGTFQSGKALFMRNWPYAWSLANTAESRIRGKVGVTTLPSGSKQGPRAGTLGGWSLAVSKYSAHQKQAADLVFYLTSKEEQKRRALEAGLYPSITSLYEDEQLIKANPIMSQLLEAFSQAVARPARSTGAKYNRVSSEFWNTVHEILSKKASPSQGLQSLDQKLERISRNGKW